MNLMHCPFCGQDQVGLHCVPKSTSKLLSRYQVQCANCDAYGGIAESHKRDTAIEAAIANWNTRIPHDEDLAKRVAFEMEK